ncbi:MAG: putative branched-chain amino acid permease, azaleucine resistance, partial [Pseudomonadota bacterium]
RPYLMHLPLRWRLCHGYMIGDFSYVLFTKRYHHPGVNETERREQLAYLSGSTFCNWLGWQGSNLLGIALAHVIPAHWGLGFAGILALLGVGCSLASSHLRRIAAGVAGLAAVVAYALPFKLNIVVAIACAVTLCLILEAAWPRPPVAPGTPK